MSLSNCRVVLVRTHYAGNLGAVARVMRNFGVSDLVLVSPHASTSDLEARRMATHGLSLLDSARVVAELGDAIGDCVYTLATSGTADGTFRQTFVGTPEQQLPRLVEAMGTGPVALVFGPEPHGLSNAEITRCQGLIRIPVDTQHSSMNLSQAVTVCLYELRKEFYRTPRDPEKPRHELAAHEDQERMFTHLQEALEAIHYLYGTKAGPLMHAVRHLIGRAMPTPQEVKLLHGLARQMLYLARTSGPNDSVTS